MQDAAYIPLRARDGSIRAHAIVDATDYDRLSRWRWTLRPDGYVYRRSKREGSVYLHRQLLGLRRGDALFGDHINGDRLDNRRANLRAVTPAESQQNRPSNRRVTSRFRGVSWHAHTRKWRAQVQLDGKSHYLGVFEREEDAAAAAAAFRRAHMPFTTER